MLTELLRREKQLNIKPDPYLDALMKVQKRNPRLIWILFHEFIPRRTS